MRRLRYRRGVDALQNQPRSRRQALIRWVYLASIAGLAIWMGDLFFGSLLYLRSEGLVLGEPAIVAAEFPVTVRAILVRAGEQVESGRIAATVSSQNAVETIARLTAELAARETRLSELRIRAQTVDAMLGMAENRQDLATNARKELEKLLERGYLSLDKRVSAVESEFRSRQDLEGLKAERRVTESEIATLHQAFVDAETAIRDLRRLYDDGRMRVPIDGLVSRVVAEKGAVVRAGEPLVEIYGNSRFVLAYLPTGGMYKVAVGDRVNIKTGLYTAAGIVARVEPFAAALPREFQRTFTPVERQQVIRVEFAAGAEPPPLFTKVQLGSAEMMPRVFAHMWEQLKSSIAALALRESAQELADPTLRPSLM
jgi:multidrug resistance efflux pump